MSDGEDGPTHQPVEHLASLRAIPPRHAAAGGADEVVEASRCLVPRRRDRAVLVLSQQRCRRSIAQVHLGRRRGPRRVHPRGPARWKTPKRSDRRWQRNSLALEAARQLIVDGVRSRVVSMPSSDIFERPAEGLRGRPAAGVTARMAIEQASRWVGAYIGRPAGHRGADVRRLGAVEGPEEGVWLHGRQCGRRGQGPTDAGAES